MYIFKIEENGYLTFIQSQASATILVTAFALSANAAIKSGDLWVWIYFSFFLAIWIYIVIISAFNLQRKIIVFHRTKNGTILDTDKMPVDFVKSDIKNFKLISDSIICYAAALFTTSISIVTGLIVAKPLIN